MKLNNFSKIIISLFIAVVLLWSFISFNSIQNSSINYYFSLGIGVVALFGGIFGLYNSKKWGSLRSSVGKSLFFISLGLLFWSLGTFIFGYYNIFLSIEAPYPSLADASYIISWPLWVIGMFYFIKATGAKFQLKKRIGRIIIFVIPIIVMVLSYYVLIIVARQGIITDGSGGVLKNFFDIAYPVGDVIILTITVLIYSLSFNYLGGFFKWPIIIIIGGFIFNYIADFIFIYTVTKETFYVGDFGDLFYVIAFFLLGLGVSLMDVNRLNDNILTNT